MNALTRRVSRLEVQLAPSVESKAQEEYWRAVEERIWECKRSRMTREELVLEERKMAIVREACRGHKTIAEAIWHGQAARRKFEAEQK
jgi:hypothetical protein